MATLSRNHKPLPELDVDPADIPALTARARMLPGVSPTVARNFGGWLLAVHTGGEISQRSAVRFRKILRRLVDDGPPGEGGYASIKALGTVAALAVSGLATMRGNAPVALASLYITNIMGVAGEKGPARARR